MGEKEQQRRLSVHRGIFEEHRLLIRWLLRRAGALDPPESKPAKEDDAVFYAEEVAWLLNECGVLSLAQGRLQDAVALLERAQRAAERIEPNGTGALRTRIGLNAVIADIERGRLSRARALLTEIAGIPDEHPIPRLLAEGYLGLIDHVTGRLDSASERYRKALGISAAEASSTQRSG